MRSPSLLPIPAPWPSMSRCLASFVAYIADVLHRPLEPHMPGSAFPPDDDHDDLDDELNDEFGDGADDEGDEEDDEPSGEAVFVTTAVPVQIRVAPFADERVPDGSALASYLGDRMIARCAMPREAVERLMELDLFAQPLPLALLAYEEEPGLQC